MALDLYLEPPIMTGGEVRIISFCAAVCAPDPKCFAELAENLELQSSGGIITSLDLLHKGLIFLIENLAAGGTDITMDEAEDAFRHALRKSCPLSREYEPKHCDDTL